MGNRRKTERCCWLWWIEQGTMSQGMWAAFPCKRQGNRIPFSASQRNADHLLIVQGDFEILTSRTARSINLCCFKLLGLQSFVIAATRNSYTSTEDSRAKERWPCVPMTLESCHPSPGWPNSRLLLWERVMPFVFNPQLFGAFFYM